MNAVNHTAQIGPDRRDTVGWSSPNGAVCVAVSMATSNRTAAALPADRPRPDIAGTCDRVPAAGSNALWNSSDAE